MGGIIKWALISLILILLLHHLFTFFMDTLTIPKIKDLVNQPSQSYREINKTLETCADNNNNNNNDNNNDNTTNINDLQISNNDKNEMKNELKQFFVNLKQDKNISSNEFSNDKNNTFSELSNNINYSQF